jgi:small GTP-binding protein
LLLLLTPCCSYPLQLWDTAGQERFRTIAVAYFRGANAIMLVFDLTVRGSFLAVESWVRDIDKNADKKVAKILVGNKADLADGEGRRAVTQAEATKMAAAHGMTYIETSAKSGLNVDAAFERLAGTALENLKREKPEPKPTPVDDALDLNPKKKKPEEKKGWGC